MRPLFCLLFSCLILLLPSCLAAQSTSLQGSIRAEGQPLAFASIGLEYSKIGTSSDSSGRYSLSDIPPGQYTLVISYLGYTTLRQEIRLRAGEDLQRDFELLPDNRVFSEVVVTGTLKEVKRLDSPVPVEVYSPAFFRKNPSPNLFEALQNVNGVRPQLNCNICNTGDIHMNGLEGPYTMVLIDGMPIVSSLSTVYGLSGIPTSLIERIEIVRGPASSLYGSEAVGGLINVITKKPGGAPRLLVDVMGTSWEEYNADLGFAIPVAGKAQVLSGVQYYKYGQPRDHNQDGFTDVTLQDRVSLFQKWHFKRPENRVFSLAGRYFYEDRWGGQMNWNPAFRGGDSIYGESIYTSRWEMLGHYQLPLREKFLLSFSFNDHAQDSRYGVVSYIARQRIGFGQMTWDKQYGRQDLLAGIALRYSFYDDNTPATAFADSLDSRNEPQKVWLPGVFVQDEIALHPKHRLLLGMRYDHNSTHGSIYTPRLAYKWTLPAHSSLRLNAGTGFRVVNLFTEDHAALTGARRVVIENELRPEKSYNVNLNLSRKFFGQDGSVFSVEGSAFYTYFNNRIVADYESDPNLIRYDNLQGYAVSTGISLNLDLVLPSGIKLLAGGTYMDVSLIEDGQRSQQILTEKFTATWALTLPLARYHLSFDYTGNVYSPMRLPLLGPLDPRRPESPWWSIQNIQCTYSWGSRIELYGGIKNLLNWTPNRGNPFIIARANDPFDKNVQYDANGQVLATPENPYALSFDPNYVYGPNQGIRGFLGFRYFINREASSCRL